SALHCTHKLLSVISLRYQLQNRRSAANARTGPKLTTQYDAGNVGQVGVRENHGRLGSPRPFERVLTRPLLEHGISAALEQAAKPPRGLVAVAGQKHEWQSALWHPICHAPAPANRVPWDFRHWTHVCKPGAADWRGARPTPRLATRPVARPCRGGCRVRATQHTVETGSPARGARRLTPC